jgi:hypothetical protein
MNNKVVYIHKLNGKVVYVGSGCKLRVNSKSCRSLEHLEIWDKLQIEIVSENLSVTESIRLEQSLIDDYWSSGKLLNKNRNVYSVKQISFEDLDKVLYYDETSFTFLRWKVNTGLTIKAGTPAGRIDHHGYARIRFEGKNYQAHRIVLVLNTKEDIPDGFVVDHIDGNKSNNSLNNLRIVSQSDNIRNKSHKKSNTGFQCICEDINRKNFRVSFTDSKQIFTYFSYTDKPTKATKSHYPTRELALEAALAYRNSLVDQGLIILTNKEETKWQLHLK